MCYYSKFFTRPLCSSTCAALMELYHSQLNRDTSSVVKVQVSEGCMLIILGYHIFMQGSIVHSDLCGFKIMAHHHLHQHKFWRRQLTCILGWQCRLSKSINYRIDIILLEAGRKEYLSKIFWKEAPVQPQCKDPQSR